MNALQKKIADFLATSEKEEYCDTGEALELLSAVLASNERPQPRRHPRAGLGIVLYRGPSELNGDPIVAILTHETTNPKTGPMAQVWIIPDLDVPPHVASKAGADESVCGDCPLRHYLGGACYVAMYQAPRAVWAALQRGRYGQWDGKAYDGAIRLGAYGDPAAVPMHVWRRLMPRSAHPHTGYTRQWRKPSAQPLKSILMASVHNSAEAREAQAMGWRVFEVVHPGQTGTGNTKKCPSDVVSCAQCLACDGGDGSSRWIEVHGSRAGRLAVVN